MSEAVLNLLRAFEALPPAEQHEMAAEILRRYTPEGPLPDAAFDELAADLCRGYDAEEDTSAAP